MDEEMLEAHVAFEVAAWTESLDETLAEQIETIMVWLDGVSLGSVLSAADLDLVLETLPVPDITASVLAIHEAAAGDDTPLSDLVREEDYDRVTAALAQLTELQDWVVEQITSSNVYADLISHVLLHGITTYLTLESPLAKVPGASSLMKMGQSAIGTAAPRLSKGIERQITAFVSAILQDTLRDSREFLTEVIDDEALDRIAIDVWERNADTPVSEIASLVPTETLMQLSEIAYDAVTHLIATETFREAAHSILAAHAARPVGEVLAAAGITTESLVAQLRPWILRAADDGVVEALVRHRLTPFYESY